jgi:glycosyltransferase involved in cell wall biosynthesis
VVPVLDAEKILPRALESIRDQRYPQHRVEIVLADAGSVDATREVGERFGAVVVGNPRGLAEFGVKEGIRVAHGELVVIFAADNELVGSDWLEHVTARFEADDALAAIFGRLVSADGDPALNKYVELIQSDPLNWFLNRNLVQYLRASRREPDGAAIFDVDPRRPLIWGANGLALRTAWIRPYWLRPGYVADVDAFHRLIQDGRRRVAYYDRAYCYHHQVATFGDLRRKWRRNLEKHLVAQAENRDLSWFTVQGFRLRLALWLVYSLIPAVSLADAVRRALVQRSWHWLFHPPAAFLQTITYASVIARDSEARRVFIRILYSES